MTAAAGNAEQAGLTSEVPAARRRLSSSSTRAQSHREERPTLFSHQAGVKQARTLLSEKSWIKCRWQTRHFPASSTSNSSGKGNSSFAEGGRLAPHLASTAAAVGSASGELQLSHSTFLHEVSNRVVCQPRRFPIRPAFVLRERENAASHACLILQPRGCIA